MYREIEFVGISSEVRGRVDGWGDSFFNFGCFLFENENKLILVIRIIYYFNWICYYIDSNIDKCILL